MNEKDPCWPCDQEVIEKVPPCPLQCRSSKCKSYNAPPLDSKPIIWVLGGPGCGKNVQCAKMAAKYGFKHVSTGDLLRAEVASNSIRARCLAKAMAHGELVPNDVVLDLLKETILKNVKSSKGFLIDGYPREKFQGIAFEKQVAPCKVILYFEATPETLRNRLLQRAATSKRKDDNEEVITKRLKTFEEHNPRVLAQYADRLHRINAEQTPDEIFRDVEKILDAVLAEKPSEARPQNMTTKRKLAPDVGAGTTM